MESNQWLEIFKVREVVDRVISEFLLDNSVRKAYLPTIAQTVTPEHYTDSFTVSSDVSKEHYFLQPSPEFYLKKLIAETNTSFYYLGPVYRAGEDMKTTIHIPEFTMLEWYKIGYSITQFEDMTIELILTIIETVQSISFFNGKIPTVHRVTWNELFLMVGVSISDLRKSTIDASQKNIRDYLEETDDFSSAFYKIYYTELFSKIDDGDIWLLTEFPKEMSALSVVKDDVSFRFELYWKGVELVNAYFEERSALKLQLFFEKSNIERKKEGKFEIKIDEDFVDKSSKLPVVSGGSLGIDRLLYLLIKDKMGLKSLDEMIFNFF